MLNPDFHFSQDYGYLAKIPTKSKKLKTNELNSKNQTQKLLSQESQSSPPSKNKTNQQDTYEKTLANNQLTADQNQPWRETENVQITSDQLEFKNFTVKKKKVRTKRTKDRQQQPANSKNNLSAKRINNLESSPYYKIDKQINKLSNQAKIIPSQNNQHNSLNKTNKKNFKRVTKSHSLQQLINPTNKIINHTKQKKNYQEQVKQLHFENNQHCLPNEKNQSCSDSNKSDLTDSNPPQFKQDSAFKFTHQKLEKGKEENENENDQLLSFKNAKTIKSKIHYVRVVKSESEIFFQSLKCDEKKKIHFTDIKKNFEALREQKKNNKKTKITTSLNSFNNTLKQEQEPEVTIQFIESEILECNTQSSQNSSMLQINENCQRNQDQDCNLNQEEFCFLKQKKKIQIQSSNQTYFSEQRNQIEIPENSPQNQKEENQINENIQTENYNGFGILKFKQPKDTHLTGKKQKKIVNKKQTEKPKTAKSNDCLTQAPPNRLKKNQCHLVVNPKIYPKPQDEKKTKQTLVKISKKVQNSKRINSHQNTQNKKLSSRRASDVHQLNHTEKQNQTFQQNSKEQKKHILMKIQNTKTSHKINKQFIPSKHTFSKPSKHPQQQSFKQSIKPSPTQNQQRLVSLAKQNPKDYLENALIAFNNILLDSHELSNSSIQLKQDESDQSAIQTRQQKEFKDQNPNLSQLNSEGSNTSKYAATVKETKQLLQKNRPFSVYSEAFPQSSSRKCQTKSQNLVFNSKLAQNNFTINQASPLTDKNFKNELKINPCLFKKKIKFFQYTLDDITSFIEEHKARIEAFCQYIDNSKYVSEGENNFKRIQFQLFLMLKKILFQISRAVAALEQKGQNPFSLSGIQIPDQILHSFLDRQEIKQQLSHLMQLKNTNLQKFYFAYEQLIKKQDQSKGLSLSFQKDNFSTQIVKNLGQELNNLYEKWEKDRSCSNEPISQKCLQIEERMIEIIELIFLLCELDGKKTKPWQLLEGSVKFSQYYEFWFQKIIDAIEYFDEKSKSNSD